MYELNAFLILSRIFLFSLFVPLNEPNNFFVACAIKRQRWSLVSQTALHCTNTVSAPKLLVLSFCSLKEDKFFDAVVAHCFLLFFQRNLLAG